MKKRFPRFSLRALVIAVLGIAVCWTLTATWGVNTLLNQSPWPKERRGNAVHIERKDDDGRLYVWDSQATAFLPFFIRETTQCQMPGGNKANYSFTYFWFFGYYREIDGPQKVLQKR